jgi:hypothetical protein
MKATEADSGEVGVPPWIANPNQLGSWWDMEKYFAESFYQLARTIEYIATRSRNNVESSNQLPEELRKSHIDGLTAALGMCKHVNLALSALYVDRFIKELKSTKPMTGIEFADKLGILQDRIQDETSQTLILRIPPERASRYEQAQPFGAEVDTKFPSVAFDAKEAGNCFAAMRSTACVFHLMRVLELGLAVFAKLFGVASDHTNWHTIIEQIESKIRNMGNDPSKTDDWKQKQETYAQIANSFMFFKDAWRNYTAHARGKYTEDEADSIYRNVRSFMQGMTK